MDAEEYEGSPSSNFFYDVGADFLDVADILMELEKEFGITVADEDEDFKHIKTVDEAIMYIINKLK